MNIFNVLKSVGKMDLLGLIMNPSDEKISELVEPLLHQALSKKQTDPAGFEEMSKDVLKLVPSVETFDIEVDDLDEETLDVCIYMTVKKPKQKEAPENVPQ